MDDITIYPGSKRKILIVEDNELNRDILSSILEPEFDILTACDGKEGLDILSKYYRNLSLILLDVYMPVMNGFEFLTKISRNSMLSFVPVIVTTGSNKSEDEIKCLKLGASDFVTKPYNPEVVLGRVHSIIKLKESVATLSVVEFDQLTGLYTMSAFYHHASEILNQDPRRSYDLVMTDIRDFKLINSILGEKRGDEVLKNVAQLLRIFIPDAVIARRGDSFFALYESRELVNSEITRSLIDDFEKNIMLPNINLKFGLYRNVDKSLSVATLCDRVMLAVADIKNDVSLWFSEYNESVQNRLVHNQELESAFDNAIKNNEFKVWYQTKVETKTGKIIGAEALVRWNYLNKQLILPGDFISIFENDGLVSQLDEYVFREVCRLQHSRIASGKAVIPISVNISRNSIYQGRTVSNYKKIVAETGVGLELVPLELTESAATEGAQISILTEQLKEAGFILHMDDFGKGYSSLSCLTTMPFDVIKLDKSIIDKIGDSKGNTVIRHMITIAQEMGMEVVAEGVETAEQVQFLKDNGCDIIQGYFFSKPVDSDEFEKTVDNL